MSLFMVFCVDSNVFAEEENYCKDQQGYYEASKCNDGDSQVSTYDVSDVGVVCCKKASSSSSSSSSSTSGSNTAFKNMEKIPGQEQTSDLVEYLNSIYTFGIAISAILALFMVTLGGFRYIISSAGNASKAGDAKDMIFSAIYGLILALVAWLILFVINPDLIEGAITGTKNLDQTISGGSTGNTGNLGSGKCQAITDDSNSCSVNNLKSYFGDNAEKASAICNCESVGGNPSIGSGSDKCQPGGEVVSWGLFQVNISAHDLDSNKYGHLECTKAFDDVYEGSDKTCSVIDSDLYNKCVEAAKDPETNIKKAVQISKSGTSWSAWGCNSNYCKF